MKNVKTISAIALAITLAMTSGCQNMNKQNMGTMIGAGAGAAVGSLFGEGNGKIAAVLVGSIVGGIAGNMFGQSLDESDQADLDAATRSALDNGKAGSTTSWKSSRSGATANITVGQAFNKTENVTVKRLVSIEPATNMSLINQPYVTLKSSNVRAAPRMSGEKVTGLQPGVQFNAIGQAGDWVMVGRKGVQIGYIHKDLVMPVAEYASLPTPPQKQAAAPAKNVAKAAQKDDAPISSNPLAKGSAPINSNPLALAKIEDVETKQAVEKVVETPAISSSTCRELKADLKGADGKTQTANTTSCKPAFGSWMAKS